ncbi:MAG: DUF2157 domain-containing protein [Gammaproteobacteria bacterium]|nr:DUF2157 domain-containing protein [Gammaproteobacteria bacterium]
MSIFLLVLILLLIGGGIWGWPILAGFLGLSTVHDKPGALQHIRQLMTTYDISPGEVDAVFNAPPLSKTSESKRSKSEVATTLFSYLGAIFILAGIGTYISTFWDSMGSVMRVVVTLGVGYIMLIVMVSAAHENKHPRLVLPLALFSTFFMVGGWFVFMDEVFPDTDNWRLAALFVFGVMAIQWGLLFSKYRRTLFAFLALVFVYGFLQVGLDLLDVSPRSAAVILGASLIMVATALEKTPQRMLCEPALLIGVIWLNAGLFDLVADIAAANWASCIIGLSLLCTAYGLHRADRYARLAGLGYLFGSAMFYTGLFDLLQDTSVEILFLAITAGVLYACVVLQSRALLATTVIAMLSYIGYFSAENFADSLGWPITLVLMGVAFLGVGTLALRVRRKL